MFANMDPSCTKQKYFHKSKSIKRGLKFASHNKYGYDFSIKHRQMVRRRGGGGRMLVPRSTGIEKVPHVVWLAWSGSWRLPPAAGPAYRLFSPDCSTWVSRCYCSRPHHHHRCSDRCCSRCSGRWPDRWGRCCGHCWEHHWTERCSDHCCPFVPG